jgi:chorismate-pyruvate lyase
MKTLVDFKVLADIFIFGHRPIGEIVASESLEFRKGKTQDDIHNAWKKSLKHGNDKIEHELELFEIYLKQIFKSKRIQ